MLARWGIDWAGSAVAASAGQPPAGQAAGRGSRPQAGGHGRAGDAARRSTTGSRRSAPAAPTQSVAVTPYASGRLTELEVSPGQRVEAGAVIAKLDAEGEKIAVDRAGSR